MSHGRDDSGHVVKRRNKPSLVCTSCKKRKIKCDKKLPCTACAKANIGYSCYYETRPAAKDKKKKIKAEEPINIDKHKDSKYQDEILLLKRRIKDLEAESKTSSLHEDILESLRAFYKDANHKRPPVLPLDSDYLSTKTNPYMYNPVMPTDENYSFYQGYCPIQVKEPFRRTNFGPLSWTSLMQKDYWITLVRRTCSYYNRNTVEYSLYSYSAPKLPHLIKLVDKERPDFQRTALENEGVYEVVPLKNLPTLGESKTLNKSNLTFGRTLFEGKFDAHLELMDKIRYILPRKKVFWTLIDKYFDILYPHSPCLDQKYFMADLSKILGPADYSDVPFGEIKVERKLDLAIIAIALILLRMTFLSLFSNRESVNETLLQNDWDGETFTTAKELKYLLSNPINVSAIEVAQLCVNCFQLTRKTNLTIFQAVLYMRMYHRLAPEDGDGLDGGDSQISTALLVQMAYSLGLNREPSLFPEVCSDPRINNLTRKIWHFLVRIDITHAFGIGNPTSIETKHYDTKPPYFEAGNENTSSQVMEETVCESFYYFYCRIDLMRKTLDMISDVNQATTINTVTQFLNNYESRMRAEFGSLLDHDDDNTVVYGKTSPTHFNIIFKVQFLLNNSFNLVSVYYHLYLHYEEVGNIELTFFYLKKMFRVILEFILPYFEPIVNGSLSRDGFLLNPMLITAIHKINQICISVLIRIFYLRDHFPKDAPKVENCSIYIKYKNMSQTCSKLAHVCVQLLIRYAPRYYYAWRLSKAHKYVLKGIQEFPYDKADKFIESKKRRIFQFSGEQVDEINQSVHQVLIHIQKVLQKKDKCSKEDLSDLKLQKHGIFGLKYGLDTDDISSLASSLDFNDTSQSNSSETMFGDQEVDNMWLLMLAMKGQTNDNFSLDWFSQAPTNIMGERSTSSTTDSPSGGLGVDINPEMEFFGLNKDGDMLLSEALLSTDFGHYSSGAGFEALY